MKPTPSVKPPTYIKPSSSKPSRATDDEDLDPEIARELEALEAKKQRLIAAMKAKKGAPVNNRLPPTKPKPEMQKPGTSRNSEEYNLAKIKHHERMRAEMMRDAHRHVSKK